MDHADAFFVVAVALGTEHHRAEAVAADLDAGAAEGSIAKRHGRDAKS
jgi:hypothetical protein